jgi:hypothetical protein
VQRRYEQAQAILSSAQRTRAMGYVSVLTRTVFRVREIIIIARKTVLRANRRDGARIAWRDVYSIIIILLRVCAYYVGTVEILQSFSLLGGTASGSLPRTCCNPPRPCHPRPIWQLSYYYKKKPRPIVSSKQFNTITNPLDYFIRRITRIDRITHTRVRCRVNR